MYKVAVIGDKDSIYGYSALGLDIYPVTDSDNKIDIFKKICNGSYGIIYITEALADELEKEIDKYREQVIPAIISIPGIYGNTGKGISSVKKCVEQAVGSDIIFNK